MKIFTILFIVLTIPMFAPANIVNARITGVVKNFDDKKVILAQDGRTMEVPREFFEKGPLKTGNTVSSKELSPADLSRIH